jgi:hypothetical protein
VLVEQQAAAGGAVGGVEGGVAPDGLAVLVDPRGADPRAGSVAPGPGVATAR